MPRWDYITKDETRALQGKLLSRFIREQVYPFSPYYREMFDREGLTPADFRTFDDLRKIPFSSKENIAPSEEDPARPRRIILQPDPATIKDHLPLGKKLSLLAGKMRGVDPAIRIKYEYLPIHFIATTGRTANSTPFVYSGRDVDRMRQIGKRLYTAGGMDTTDTVFNVFPYAPHLAFWVVALGAMEAGVPCFNTGGGKVLGTERILITASKMKATVLTGVPGYVYHLLRIAIDMKLDLSHIRTIVLGAERVTDGHRKKMAEMLGELGSKNPVILGTYGFTESRTAWVECPGKDTNGYHLYPDFEIFEIIDPNTNEPVGDGEDGEIVYTCLDWRGSCILRYRTGDYAKGGIVHDACPGCGRLGPRLTNDITRLSNLSEFRLTSVRGTVVNLNDLVPIMTDLDEIIEWQIEITKVNNDPHELDELNLYIAVGENCDNEKLIGILGEKFAYTCEVKPSAIHFLSPDEIVSRLKMETSPKEERIVDHRPEINRKWGLE